MRLIVALCVCCWVASAGLAGPPQAAGAIDPIVAAKYFREFDALCAEDGGKLWGLSLCGPILLVDPPTRTVVANRGGASELLTPRAGVFVGELPDNVGIANTATEWDGTRWTMLMIGSIDSDPRRRMGLMVHEAFHRIQPELGLDVFGEMNSHLDEADGRIWIQLEWNALQQALLEPDEKLAGAITDALCFRAARRAAFSGAAERENPLEIFEGLAEYSGMRLAGYTAEQVVEAVNEKRTGSRTFVRSFAYVSGPLYGYLLDRTAGGWRSQVDGDTDLGALLSRLSGLATPPAAQAEARVSSYGGEALRLEERGRETRRRERLAAWRAELLDGPVLIVDLRLVASVSFDPNQVFPFSEGQTVYTSRELIADWGVLSVEGAILEDDATGRGRISLAGAVEDYSAGDGWTLKLNEGFKVVPGERTGDVVVRRE